MPHTTDCALECGCEDGECGPIGAGVLAFVTTPHGEHTIACIDPERDGLWEIEDSQGRRLGFTGQELDSLFQWWCRRNGTAF